jgi:Domain of Unknown Function (DUF1080)
MRAPKGQAASAFLAVGMTAALMAQGLVSDFEKDELGKPPTGFSFARTGQGRPGVWVIRKDDPAHGNVLAQTDADTTGYRFPVAIYDGFTAKDVDIAVQFKAVSGKGDQGAGLVWRYRDANNYYVTRCNALEDNCTIYHVVNGNRQEFQNKNVKVATNMWHSLRVQATGDHFVVTYDGKAVLDARDRTFTDAGKIGLWTKADSVIYFDDLQMKELAAPAAAPSPKILGQRLVDDLAKAHPELARIGLHITPLDKPDNIIIASNVPAKIGQKSDPEDLAVMKTGRPVVLKEGENYDCHAGAARRDRQADWRAGVDVEAERRW